VVEEFQWSNSHAQIMLTVRDEQREVIEMASVGAFGVAAENSHTRHADHCDYLSTARRSNAGHLLTVQLPDGTQMDGGRDRPGVLQELRKEAVAAEALMAQLVKNR
jgi:hypothetical protein